MWIPGAGAPSPEDFVARVNRTIERFAQERAGGKAAVEVELADGSLFHLVSLLPEPGYGFVTLCPHCEESGAPEELIVPVGLIREFHLRVAEDRPHYRFGFAPADDQT